MAELVKVKFIRNSPPYFVGDVAGWTEEEAQRLVGLGLVEWAEEKVAEPTPSEPTPPPPPATPPAKPAGFKPLAAMAPTPAPKPVEAPATDPGAAATP